MPPYLWSMVWVASQPFTRAIPGIDSYISIPCFILNTFFILQIPLVSHVYWPFCYVGICPWSLVTYLHQLVIRNISEGLTSTLSKVTRLLTITAPKQFSIFPTKSSFHGVWSMVFPAIAVPYLYLLMTPRCRYVLIPFVLSQPLEG